MEGTRRAFAVSATCVLVIAISPAASMAGRLDQRAWAATAIPQTTLDTKGRGLGVSTLSGDGRLAVVVRSGQLSIVNNHSEVLRQPLNGPSIASAAASCTHLFVSSTNELVTFDVKTMTPIERLPWTDGGRNAPVIGPQGHVYAMTNFGLFVFPPPQPLPVAGGPRTACDPVVVGKIPF